MPPMKPSALLLLLLALAFCSNASAQTAASAPRDNNGSQLETLIRKIDEQNMKIDALSQQILKLEQQISSIRPGVMIGETTPPPAPAAAAAATAASSVTPQGGNAHVVAKGETLTSIAKAYKVGVGELQKFNHIENDRALQIGQTVMIPTPGASPAPTSPAP
jgi:LysM repeat protein